MSVRIFSIALLLAAFLPLAMLHPQTTAKKNIAVIELQSRGGLSESEMGVLTDRLRSMLVKTKAFNVVDRSRMQEVLKEQGFQMSGCTSAECAVEAGKILGVQQMVAGTIGRIGQLFAIDIMLIDVGSSKIIKSITRDYTGEIEGIIGLMEPLANELSGVAGTPTSEAPETGALHIISEPEQAAVFINDRQAGQSPLQKEDLEPGKYTIRVTADGYAPDEQTVEITPGLTVQHRVRLKAVSALEIRTRPEKATVFVNGDKAGTTPLKLDNLSAGKHQLKIQAEGYLPVEEEITLEKGKTARLIRDLKKLYALEIKSKPADAELILNGKSVGKTPFTSALPEGTRLEIHLKKDNYKTWQKVLTLNRDARFNVTLEMTEAYKNSLAGKTGAEEQKTEKTDGDGGSSVWWWIGGGVAVGAAAAIYFLKPDDGDNSDDEYPAPPGRPNTIRP